MELETRQIAVLGKLGDSVWHTPAQLVDEHLGYQQVNAALKRLHDLGLAEREQVGGKTRLRFRYHLTAAGRNYLEGAERGV